MLDILVNKAESEKLYASENKVFQGNTIVAVAFGKERTTLAHHLATNDELFKALEEVDRVVFGNGSMKELAHAKLSVQTALAHYRGELQC